MKGDRVYIDDRPVDPEWQRRLDSIAGGTDKLHITWHPGAPWEPLGRYVIYELVPMKAMGDEWDEEFKLGAPRKRGRWDSDPEALGGRRWISDALVSQKQYEVWEATGCFPILLWIVQGEGGGHLARLTHWQDKLFRLRNPGEQWPVPGELPFAEPSESTFRFIALHDRLRQADQQGEDEYEKFSTSTIIDLSGSREARIRAHREKLNSSVAEWLEEQMYAVKQIAPHGVFDEAREGAVDAPPLDPDQVKEEFIHGE